MPVALGAACLLSSLHAPSAFGNAVGLAAEAPVAAFLSEGVRTERAILEKLSYSGLGVNQKLARIDTKALQKYLEEIFPESAIEPGVDDYIKALQKSQNQRLSALTLSEKQKSKLAVSSKELKGLRKDLVKLLKENRKAFIKAAKSGKIAKTKDLAGVVSKIEKRFAVKDVQIAKMSLKEFPKNFGEKTWPLKNPAAKELREVIPGFNAMADDAAAASVRLAGLTAAQADDISKATYQRIMSEIRQRAAAAGVDPAQVQLWEIQNKSAFLKRLDDVSSELMRFRDAQTAYDKAGRLGKLKMKLFGKVPREKGVADSVGKLVKEVEKRAGELPKLADKNLKFYLKGNQKGISEAISRALEKRASLLAADPKGLEVLRPGGVQTVKSAAVKNPWGTLPAHTGAPFQSAPTGGRVPAAAETPVSAAAQGESSSAILKQQLKSLSAAHNPPTTTLMRNLSKEEKIRLFGEKFGGSQVRQQVEVLKSSWIKEREAAMARMGLTPEEIKAHGVKASDIDDVFANLEKKIVASNDDALKFNSKGKLGRLFSRSPKPGKLDAAFHEAHKVLYSKDSALIKLANEKWASGFKGNWVQSGAFGEKLKAVAPGLEIEAMKFDEADLLRRLGSLDSKNVPKEVGAFRQALVDDYINQQKSMGVMKKELQIWETRDLGRVAEKERSLVQAIDDYNKALADQYQPRKGITAKAKGWVRDKFSPNPLQRKERVLKKAQDLADAVHAKTDVHLKSALENAKLKANGNGAKLAGKAQKLSKEFEKTLHAKSVSLKFHEGIRRIYGGAKNAATAMGNASSKAGLGAARVGSALGKASSGAGKAGAVLGKAASGAGKAGTALASGAHRVAGAGVQLAGRTGSAAGAAINAGKTGLGSAVGFGNKVAGAVAGKLAGNLAGRILLKTMRVAQSPYLLPLIAVQMGGEASARELLRTKELMAMGVEVKSDPLSIIQRGVGSEGKAMLWNTSEKLGIMNSSVYGALVERELGSIGLRLPEGRVLTEDEINIVQAEAARRVDERFLAKIDPAIRELMRLKDPIAMNAGIETLLERMNADSEMTLMLDRQFTAQDVREMIERSLEKEREYLDVKGGTFLKQLSDPFHDTLLVLDDAIGEPAAKFIEESHLGENLQGFSDLIKPVAEPLSALLDPAFKFYDDTMNAMGQMLAGGSPEGEKPWYAGGLEFFGGLLDSFAGGDARKKEMLADLDAGQKALDALAAGDTDLPDSPMKPEVSPEPILASMVPAWKTAKKPECGEGYIGLWKGDSRGWECGRLPEAKEGASVQSSPKSSPVGATRMLNEDALGAIKVEKKSLAACKPYYVLLDSGVCIKDTGLFRETGNPRIPYRGVAKCSLGEKIKPSEKPRKGAKLCVRLR